MDGEGVPLPPLEPYASRSARAGKYPPDRPVVYIIFYQMLHIALERVGSESAISGAVFTVYRVAGLSTPLRLPRGVVRRTVPSAVKACAVPWDGAICGPLCSRACVPE
jgi:hypothetical protein